MRNYYCKMQMPSEYDVNLIIFNILTIHKTSSQDLKKEMKIYIMMMIMHDVLMIIDDDGA